jgi:hypothetical protein
MSNTNEHTTQAAKRAEAFRDLADNMEDEIQEKLNPAIGQLRPTRRRNNIATSMVSDGFRLQKVQTALRRLADAWENGTVPGSLEGLRHKVQVEHLVHIDRFPQPGWRDTDHKRLKRAGITDEALYAQARADLLALIDPGAGQPNEEDEQRRLEREIALKKIPGYFPTPPDVVERMLGYAQIGPGDFVLEPSAGAGHIADAIRAAHPGATLGCVEINHDLAELLRLKTHEHVGWDFMALDPGGWGYMNRVVMNPPFERGQDIDHVRHAHALLAPGGRLVSVMCEGPFFRNDSKSESFREWLDGLGGWSEQLPEDAFKSSDRPTSVRTRLVVIDKAA